MPAAVTDPRRPCDPVADPLDALIARMPKAELHLHLDGSLRPETALELARERGLDDGMNLEQMRDRLTAPPRCESQLELLRAFDLPIALMQDAEALERITHELVEDVASDGTRYVEIRWAPALHIGARALPSGRDRGGGRGRGVGERARPAWWFG